MFQLKIILKTVKTTTHANMYMRISHMKFLYFKGQPLAQQTHAHQRLSNNTTSPQNRKQQRTPLAMSSPHEPVTPTSINHDFRHGTPLSGDMISNRLHSHISIDASSEAGKGSFCAKNSLAVRVSYLGKNSLSLRFLILSKKTHCLRDFLALSLFLCFFRIWMS